MSISNSEVLEACNFCQSRAVVCVPREKEGTSPGCTPGVGISWVVLGENVPLPEVYLEEYVSPLQAQKILQAPGNHLSSAGTKAHAEVHNLVTAFRWATP